MSTIALALQAQLDWPWPHLVIPGGHMFAQSAGVTVLQSTPKGPQSPRARLSNPAQNKKGPR